MPPRGETKLTPELQARACEFIAKGSYIKQACHAAGISPRTYERWMNLGESGQGDVYVAFVAAIKEAESQAEQANVDIIKAAAIGPVITTKTVTKPDSIEVTETVAPGSWQAAGFLLERKHPARWGRREQLEHELGGSLKELVRELGKNRGKVSI